MTPNWAIGNCKTVYAGVHYESNILQQHTVMQAFQLNLLQAPVLAAIIFFPFSGNIVEKTYFQSFNILVKKKGGLGYETNCFLVVSLPFFAKG